MHYITEGLRYVAPLKVSSQNHIDHSKDQSDDSFKTPPTPFPELKDPFHPWFDVAFSLCGVPDVTVCLCVIILGASCCGVLDVM